ncbi:helix-turn-helix domain-containing protein [Vibrio anguillarum]|uniref:helix-turn-helix domain-containing protein n=1 Tax=Vibrio anguillarum TaxID=55601 RepID=UPI001F355C8F|nr:helix-turn-helix transcriptional regulator [Vibrio anguillarum]EID4391953.1 helix-turn-helix transcriptional regulator [Vibrio vulnificus]EJA3092023.1 helix-turn-helix transcriptional regulator [Vibrio parahaemolyticus]ELK8328146.1 helix-turn-helix transcriptional regulator [Vibrio vulnificus]ELN6896561.1 helix-turn-helix transcriptional regulator [Vibrio vulnificus]UJQ40082.1 helix-turn-helix domain-containing protein [Vibrio anguillarum]
MNTKLAEAVGQRIVQMRRSKGLPQEKLALLAEIDRSYMSRIERGKINISLEKLYQIADTLGCDVKDLLP